MLDNKGLKQKCTDVIFFQAGKFQNSKESESKPSIFKKERFRTQILVKRKVALSPALITTLLRFQILFQFFGP